MSDELTEEFGDAAWVGVGSGAVSEVEGWGAG